MVLYTFYASKHLCVYIYIYKRNWRKSIVQWIQFLNYLEIKTDYRTVVITKQAVQFNTACHLASGKYEAHLCWVQHPDITKFIVIFLHTLWQCISLDKTKWWPLFSQQDNNPMHPGIITIDDEDVNSEEEQVGTI